MKCVHGEGGGPKSRTSLLSSSPLTAPMMLQSAAIVVATLVANVICKRYEFLLILPRFLSESAMKSWTIWSRRRPKVAREGAATETLSFAPLPRRRAGNRHFPRCNGRGWPGLGRPWTRGKHHVIWHVRFNICLSPHNPPIFRFLKPALTSATPSLVDTMPQCCLPLARLLTNSEQVNPRNALL